MKKIGNDATAMAAAQLSPARTEGIPGANKNWMGADHHFARYSATKKSSLPAQMKNSVRCIYSQYIIETKAV